jgi:hypothetical protein
VVFEWPKEQMSNLIQQHKSQECLWSVMPKDKKTLRWVAKR